MPLNFRERSRPGCGSACPRAEYGGTKTRRVCYAPCVGREGAAHCARRGRAPRSNWIVPVKALEYAKAENKIVLLDFTVPDWCAGCINLKATFYPGRHAHGRISWLLHIAAARDRRRNMDCETVKSHSEISQPLFRENR